MNNAGTLHFIHATALVIGEQGLLIEGDSGSGKSSLAGSLIAAAAEAGRFARLVGDDRLGLTANHGRLLARPHPLIAGLIEERGLGLVAVEHEPACVLHMVVRLVPGDGPLPPRLPSRPPSWNRLGITLPLLPLLAAAGAGNNAARVLAALERIVAAAV